jgi:hypothetical protein
MKKFFRVCDKSTMNIPPFKKAEHATGRRLSIYRPQLLKNKIRIAREIGLPSLKIRNRMQKSRLEIVETIIITNVGHIFGTPTTTIQNIIL